MAKILIVDDDPDVVEAVQMCLAQQKHEVVSAYTRGEGFAAFQQSRPDLVILDVMMEQPDDGMVLARQIRKEGFGGPIFMLTNINQVTGMEFGKDEQILPVDDFQQKPIDPQVLLSKVSDLLAKKVS